VSTSEERRGYRCELLVRLSVAEPRDLQQAFVAFTLALTYPSCLSDILTQVICPSRKSQRAGNHLGFTGPGKGSISNGSL
jgi:hypothetical protein